MVSRLVVILTIIATMAAANFVLNIYNLKYLTEFLVPPIRTDTGTIIEILRSDIREFDQLQQDIEEIKQSLNISELQ